MSHGIKAAFWFGVNNKDWTRPLSHGITAAFVSVYIMRIGRGR